MLDRDFNIFDEEGDFSPCSQNSSVGLDTSEVVFADILSPAAHEETCSSQFVLIDGDGESEVADAKEEQRYPLRSLTANASNKPRAVRTTKQRKGPSKTARSPKNVSRQLLYPGNPPPLSPTKTCSSCHSISFPEEQPWQANLYPHVRSERTRRAPKRG